MFHTQLTYSNCVSRSLLLPAAWRAVHANVHARARAYLYPHVYRYPFAAARVTCVSIHTYPQQFPCSEKEHTQLRGTRCSPSPSFILPVLALHLSGTLFGTRVACVWVTAPYTLAPTGYQPYYEGESLPIPTSARDGRVGYFISTDDVDLLSGNERNGIQQR